MRQYYRLQRCVEPRIIGVKNGISQAEIIKSGFKDERLYEKIFDFLGRPSSPTRVRQEPSFEVELQCVKLLKAAKATDFLSFGPHLINCRFLASNRVKDLFKKYNVQNHHFYDANVYTKGGQQLDYYLFFCMSLDNEVIDFEKSVIYTGLRMTAESVVRIYSLEEFNALAEKSVKVVQFDKYVLNGRFDNTLDFFILNSEVFVSERLRNGIVNSGLTGVEFLPAFGNASTMRARIELEEPGLTGSDQSNNLTAIE